MRWAIFRCWNISISDPFPYSVTNFLSPSHNNGHAWNMVITKSFFTYRMLKIRLHDSSNRKKVHLNYFLYIQIFFLIFRHNSYPSPFSGNHRYAQRYCIRKIIHLVFCLIVSADFGVITNAGLRLYYRRLESKTRFTLGVLTPPQLF